MGYGVLRVRNPVRGVCHDATVAVLPPVLHHAVPGYRCAGTVDHAHPTARSATDVVRDDVADEIQIGRVDRVDAAAVAPGLVAGEVASGNGCVALPAEQSACITLGGGVSDEITVGDGERCGP